MCYLVVTYRKLNLTYPQKLNLEDHESEECHNISRKNLKRKKNGGE